MITNGKRSDGVDKWHYLTLRSLSALLRGITSNNNGDFYCLNFLIHIAHIINVKDMKEYVISMITVM